jgi:hypothetical protein
MKINKRYGGGGGFSNPTNQAIGGMLGRVTQAPAGKGAQAGPLEQPQMQPSQNPMSYQVGDAPINYNTGGLNPNTTAPVSLGATRRGK